MIAMGGRFLVIVKWPILSDCYHQETESDFYDYYTKAFRLFTNLKGIQDASKFADELKDAFIEKISEIVFENACNQEEVQSWAKERYAREWKLVSTSTVSSSGKLGEKDNL